MLELRIRTLFPHQKKTQVACWLQDLLLLILPEYYKILAGHPGQGAVAYAPTSSPECGLHAQKDIINHWKFMMSRVVCYTLLVGCCLSSTHCNLPSSEHRDFFRWAIGWRAQDFPFGRPGQVEEAENRRLLFIEFCHRPCLLSPRPEVEKGQKTRLLASSAHFLLSIYVVNTHIFSNNLQGTVGKTVVNETRILVLFDTILKNQFPFREGMMYFAG